jgi:hypothetical protein
MHPEEKGMEGGRDREREKERGIIRYKYRQLTWWQPTEHKSHVRTVVAELKLVVSAAFSSHVIITRNNIQHYYYLPHS